MPEDPQNLTVKRLREIYLERGVFPGRRVLEAMHADSRGGVQELYRLLNARLAAERRERRRISRLLKFEKHLRSQGYAFIAGVDEVGVGSMAGPVVAAAVIFPPDARFEGINDSKKLEDSKRRQLAKKIHQQALTIGIGLASVADIDKLNVYYASILAMQRAVGNLSCQPDCLLIDARELPSVSVPQFVFAKGDESHFCIAAASIVAKACRDDLMIKLDETYPAYGFAQHKGYCTALHRKALQQLGCCQVHRRSYSYLQEFSFSLPAGARAGETLNIGGSLEESEPPAKGA